VHGDGGDHQSIARSRNYLAIDAYPLRSPVPSLAPSRSSTAASRRRRRLTPTYLPTYLSIYLGRCTVSVDSPPSLHCVTQNRRRRFTTRTPTWIGRRVATRLRTFVRIFANPSIPRATLEMQIRKNEGGSNSSRTRRRGPSFFSFLLFKVARSARTP